MAADPECRFFFRYTHLYLIPLEITELSGDRRFAIEELGWTSSTSLSSSASEQRRAIKYLFDYLAQAPDRLVFLNWYTLHDMAQADYDRIAESFGIPPEYISLVSN